MIIIKKNHFNLSYCFFHYNALLILDFLNLYFWFIKLLNYLNYRLTKKASNNWFFNCSYSFDNFVKKAKLLGWFVIPKDFHRFIKLSNFTNSNLFKLIDNVFHYQLINFCSSMIFIILIWVGFKAKRHGTCC